MTKEEVYKIIKKEGDFYEWNNTFYCYIRRNNMDAWCGYVVLPKSLPLDFDEEFNIRCHGGITYQEKDSNGDTVIGFDCSHFGDLVPKMMEFTSYQVYKDKKYVIDEVNSIVEQILHQINVKRQTKIDNILESK